MNNTYLGEKAYERHDRENEIARTMREYRHTRTIVRARPPPRADRYTRIRTEFAESLQATNTQKHTERFIATFGSNNVR